MVTTRRRRGKSGHQTLLLKEIDITSLIDVAGGTETFKRV